MIIRQKTKKGIILQCIKTWEEIEETERQALVFPYGSNRYTYKNYQVRRNKHNNLLSVKPNDFSKIEKQKIASNYNEIDIMDACLEVFGNKQQRIRSVRKRERERGNNNV